MIPWSLQSVSANRIISRSFPGRVGLLFEALQDRIDAIAGLRDSGDSSGFVYGGWAAIIGRKRQA